MTGPGSGFLNRYFLPEDDHAYPSQNRLSGNSTVVDSRMIIAFSDLDGTFLDHRTYRYDRSLDGYNLLQECSIPLIFVSSKTFEEMSQFCIKLGHTFPFIFENGGGFGRYDSNDNAFYPELTGIRYEDLVASKETLKRAVEVPIVTFDEMSVADVAACTGHPQSDAVSAKKRMGSLPFLSKTGAAIDLDRVNGILKEYGTVCTKGGRLYSFSSVSSTKGTAVLDYIRTQGSGNVVSMAVGDSENDVPMLDAVTSPYAVRRHDGTHLQNKRYHITASAGPEGFTEAVKHFVDSLPCIE